MAQIVLDQVVLDFPVFDQRSRDIRFAALRTLTGARLDLRAGYVHVRALDGISLRLGPGDRLGLAGHNGSGKSTLLRLLAGIYGPTQGRAEITGSVLSLFDLAHGIQPDATGRENILLKGLSLGYGPRRVRALVDDVVAFTELGSFIDMPFRTYSSGMQLRLVFGILTSFTPDILLVDEVVGVGDGAFVDKAVARLKAQIDKIQIAVIASHNRPLLEALTGRVATLEKGRIVELTATAPAAAGGVMAPAAPSAPAAEAAA